jgi:antibiotic biosynthesis monooxygenase (ABM) superfamily enzyme
LYVGAGTRNSYQDEAKNQAHCAVQKIEDTQMIVRQWRGWAVRERAASYLQYFETHVQAQLGAVPGYRKSLVLTREQGGETEIITMTFFDRLEDVSGFAGERFEVANVSQEAQGLLSRYDKTVSHFQVALQLSPKASGMVS